MIIMGLIQAAVFVCICLVLVHAEDIILQTTLGVLRGKLLYMDNKEAGAAVAYYGIPYAAPPVGKLRFQPPEPSAPWQGTKDCTQRAAACPQDPAELVSILKGYPMDFDLLMKHPISEDCLTLDVYTPAKNAQHQLPVMVWIHGGGFRQGAAYIYDGRAYAIVHNVVYVAIQYRVGHLGFLTTGDDEIAGNMGFLDQVAALKWVRDNIDAFGGDPNQVTIFGQSAGSMSVSLHMLSPSSKGLFHRAIYQSGSIPFISGYFKTPQDAAVTTKALATYLECPIDNTKEMRECLVNIDMNKFILDLPPELAMIPHAAVQDGVHFIDSPTEMMKQGHFLKNIDVMAGTCDTEGWLVAQFLIPDVNSENLTVETADAYLFAFFNASFAMPEDRVRHLVTEMVNFYLAGKTEGALKRGIADIIGDSILTFSTYETARYIQKFSEARTYFYKFVYKGSSSKKPDFIITDHADDVFYMFQFSDFLGDNVFMIDKNYYNEKDKQVARLMTQYWANFAKTGNPNGDGLPVWPEFDEKGIYLEIGAVPTPKTNFASERMNFWRTTVPNILNQPTPTKEEL